jgi:tRNA(fMet)-specific endonuclease VapC
MTSHAAILDTNIVSHLIRFPEGPVRRRLLASKASVCVSIVTACELRFGARRIKSRLLDAQITDILSVVEPVAMGLEVIPVYADIRSVLEAQGRPIGPDGLLIAAHALALDLTLVTANVREFSRVPNLRVENWLD